MDIAYSIKANPEIWSGIGVLATHLGAKIAQRFMRAEPKTKFGHILKSLVGIIALRRAEKIAK